jgi:hypothetical protein
MVQLRPSGLIQKKMFEKQKSMKKGHQMVKKNRSSEKKANLSKIPILTK